MTSTGEPRRRHRDATTSEMVDTRYSTAIKHTQIMEPWAFCRAAGGDVARCASLNSRPGSYRPWTLETMEYVGGWGDPRPRTTTRPLDHPCRRVPTTTRPLDNSAIPAKESLAKRPRMHKEGGGGPPPPNTTGPLALTVVQRLQWSVVSGQWSGTPLPSLGISLRPRSVGRDQT